MRKSVGGQVISTKTNEELMTPSGCNLNLDTNSIVVYSFSIKNEDTKNINIKINGGTNVLLKPSETLVMDSNEPVVSCIVAEASKIRWIGLI